MEHRADLFRHLQTRWKDLLSVSFDVLLYDLTSHILKGYVKRSPWPSQVTAVMAARIADKWLPVQGGTIMAATTTRKEAIERINKTFHDALERMIPEDEGQRLPGDSFRDFELQAQAFKAALIPTLLEERARLSDSAEVKQAGCCPHCAIRQFLCSMQRFSRQLSSAFPPSHSVRPSDW